MHTWNNNKKKLKHLKWIIGTELSDFKALSKQTSEQPWFAFQLILC